MSPLAPEEIQRLDRACQEVFGLPTLLLMEHASLAVADAAEEMLADDQGLILALCGAGHNGGDAAAAARHLFNRRRRVEVLFLGARKSAPGSGDHTINFDVVRRLGIPCHDSIDPAWIAARVGAARLVLDGIVGTGLSGPLRAPLADVIAALASCAPRSLAVDIPSGLSGLTGEPLPVALPAELTVTLGFPKTGFSNPAAGRYLGRVKVADIGYPLPLRDRPGDYLNR